MAIDSSLPSPALKGLPTLELIEELTRNAGTIQQDLLAQILAQNAETEYLRGLGLDGANDQKTFKSKVPMVEYKDLWPLIQRMTDGDSSPILCAQPITAFIMSSGTTGEPKLIPTNQEILDRTLLLCAFMSSVLYKHVEGRDKGKSLYFMFSKPDKQTRGGTPVRLALTNLYRSEAFRQGIKSGFTSPIEAVLCPDPFQSMYTQMLCGLLARDQVLSLDTLFAYGIIRAINFLRLHWPQLARDIRAGSLDPTVTDGPLRDCMVEILRPDPALADSIVFECSKDDWEGIIRRIWPNAKYLGTVVTGSMVQYIPTLDFYSARLPILSMMYASSETYLGINLDPMCDPSEVSYTFMPFLAYFEFLPHGWSSDSPGPVDLVDVEVGKEYEVLITTFSGLYRYRVGDIVQVTGFHNSAPKFKFVRRKNVVLNIEAEKTKETELQDAVENASKLLYKFEMVLVDYTSFVDTSSIPGHYVIYWELRAKNEWGSWPRDNIMEKCCEAMEESFNSLYRLFRTSDHSIGPLEIRIVRNGTFEDLMDFAVGSGGGSAGQYKVPRCVNSDEIVELLNSRVVSAHFSPKVPSWYSAKLF